jgi:hypothetical protein
MNSFLEALQAGGPSADRVEEMALYGWLIGAWDLDVVEFLDDGSQCRRPGEWHFGWILQGRAIQDVWIVPPRGQRGYAAATMPAYYGTTLRIYDPRSGDWHIRYFDPAVQALLTMTGRREEDAIVQLGTNEAGQAVRWSFDEITPDGFLWRGEWSADGGASWRRRVEFRARRADTG